MLQTVKNIYSHLGDEQSKEIYANRLLFSLTGDRSYIEKIILNTELYQNICKILTEDRREKYIFGIGQWGKIITDLFFEFGFSGVIDNYAKGSYRSLPILTLKEFLEKNTDASVYIASTGFHTEFYKMLQQAGIEEERIVDVTGMMLEVYHEQQYFDLPVLQKIKEESEIFVDGGCYDAANSVMFVKWAGNIQKKVYAFEPDENNFKICRAALEQMKDLSYELIPRGLWSSDGILNFCASANEASQFAENGEEQIPVTSLDLAVDGKVTFLKMDIEGAEYEALKGAKRLICRYRPKLAISIYHKLEDIWEIPKLILSFCPEYTFYLRHYSLSSEETVLYAVILDEQKEKGI